MAKWKVTATVQSRMVDSEGKRVNEPAEMVWQRAGSEIGVMMSVAQNFEHDKDSDPFAPELLAIKIERVTE
jgi:hypothetical protein